MAKHRYRTENDKIVIDLHIKQLEQLFDSHDPAPFRERDLDDDAAEYILSSLREFSLPTPAKVVISIADPRIDDEKCRMIAEAIHNDFAYKADLTHRKLRTILRDGQKSLMIGLFFLVTFIYSAHHILANVTDNIYATIFGEGLNILGWVAMWNPINTFLYGWWKVARLRKYFLKLSEIEVDVIQKPL